MMAVISVIFFAAFLLQYSSGRSVDEKSQLKSALKVGDVEQARDLIKGGALDNLVSGKPNWEKLYGKLRALEALLSNGIATINTEDNHLNINSNRKGAFDVILVPGSSFVTHLKVNVTAVRGWGNKTMKDGRKPIHVVCLLPDVSPDIVQIILENGKDDVNARTHSKLTPLMCAATSGNLEVVKFLVEKGARINDIASLSFDGEELGGHFAFAKLFSKKELKPAKSLYHFSALESAIAVNNVDILNYLLQKGADLNHNGQSWVTLLHPVVHGDIKIVEILLRSGIDVNSKDMFGSTALHKAAELGHVEMAEFLLKNGAHLNATDVLGWMPLHVASFFSKIKDGKEMIQLLVQSGSSINSLTDEGYSPLNLVVAGHNPLFLSFLVKNIDCLNKIENISDLQEDNRDKNQTDILDTVIQLGASLNNQDAILGWSTLHWAAASGDLDAAKLLLSYGAVISVRSKMGLNPFETATYFGKKKVADFLRTAKDLVN